MADFTNSNGDKQASKTVSYVLAHPENDGVVAYLNIPIYLEDEVVQEVLASQRKLGFVVRKADAPRPNKMSVDFLKTQSK